MPETADPDKSGSETPDKPAEEKPVPEKSPPSPRRTGRATGRSAAPPSTRHREGPGPTVTKTPPPPKLTYRETPDYDAMVTKHGDPFPRDPDGEKLKNESDTQVRDFAEWAQQVTFEAMP
jgi:hypothetical protein